MRSRNWCIPVQCCVCCVWCVCASVEPGVESECQCVSFQSESILHWCNTTLLHNTIQHKSTTVASLVANTETTDNCETQQQWNQVLVSVRHVLSHRTIQCWLLGPMDNVTWPDTMSDKVKVAIRVRPFNRRGNDIVHYIVLYCYKSWGDAHHLFISVAPSDPLLSSQL